MPGKVTKKAGKKVHRGKAYMPETFKEYVEDVIDDSFTILKATKSMIAILHISSDTEFICTRTEGLYAEYQETKF